MSEQYIFFCNTLLNKEQKLIQRAEWLTLSEETWGRFIGRGDILAGF